MLLVAASVAVFIGRGSAESTTPTIGGAGTQVVAIALADMRIIPPLITVEPGTHVILRVTNTDTVRHDLSIDGGPQTPMLSHHQTAELDLGVVSQSLQGWCTVPGHRAAGMTMRIEVPGSSEGSAPSMDMPAPSGNAPVIDFAAAPGPQWKPYNPTLAPAPGGTDHQVTLTVRETITEVAPGVRQTLWTYNGTAPGPVLRGHVGDIFTVTVVNDADHAHGIDFHAGSVAPDGPMRSIDPGESLVYQFQANYSGAWLYHCSTMPMSLHIANGMFGAVIIDPPGLSAVSQEFVLIQSELYLGGQDGTANEASIAAGKPDATVFNGYVNQYADAPLQRCAPVSASGSGWWMRGRSSARPSTSWAPSSTPCSRKAPI